jgi:hypothetical protein
MLQNYMACGDNPKEALDFYSLNAYSWCGDSSFQQSGYDQLYKNVTGYNIPIFLSETGCIEPRGRLFQDQDSIFGKDMSENWSGAIVYEWIMEANEYGLVSYGPKVDPAAQGAPPDGYPRSGKPTPVSPDFDNLSNKWKAALPTGVKESAYNPSLTPVPCPAFTSLAWEVNAQMALPTLGQTYSAGEETKTGGASPSQTGAGGEGAQASANPSAKGAAPGSPAGALVSMGLGLAGVCAGFLVWM